MSLTLAELEAAGSAELAKLVERRHPDYEDELEHWQFLESCYKGGRDWIEEHLFTYHKEGAKEFRERKKRAYRFPHSREVVSLVNKYVFKGQIERSKTLPKEIKDFWGATTIRKRGIVDYMDTISTWTSTMGRVWVVVDNNIPHDVQTERERKESNGRIYSYFIKPGLAYDFAYDNDGELSWFLHGEFKRKDADPLKDDGEVYELSLIHI